MTSEKIVELQNQHLKGVTLKLIYTIIVSTVIITSSVLTTLFTLKSEMQTDRANAKLRQVEVDGKFEKIELTNSQYQQTNTQSFDQIERRLTAVENRGKM